MSHEIGSNPANGPEITLFRSSDVAQVPVLGGAANIITTFASNDRKFETGFCEVGAEHDDYGLVGYENHEFCYILSGNVTLTSANGTVQSIGPGDSIVLPQGWKGRWDSDGYTKFWVIYYPSRI